VAYRGLVVGGVRRMNEVNARRARLVLGWVTVSRRVHHLGIRYITSQLGERSLASLRGRLIEYQFRLGVMHLCRVAGNTVRSHIAREFPLR